MAKGKIFYCRHEREREWGGRERENSQRFLK